MNEPAIIGCKSQQRHCDQKTQFSFEKIKLKIAIIFGNKIGTVGNTDVLEKF